LKAATPKGTRDFSPSDLAKRNFIFDTLKSVFQLHGYEPIETPAMENLETLTGKYGEEGDRLIFKILNSGDFLSKVNKEKLTTGDSKGVAKDIAEKALKYDLTVPFARYVVQHQSDITFPFKRYQIQTVWRADRPQKGRYREFYQCDVDVIGSRSLLNEVELIQIIDSAFSKLGITGVNIGINNRKILTGIAEKLGIQEQFSDFVIALDKWDKVGKEGVQTELESKGFNNESVSEIMRYADGIGIEELNKDLQGTEGEKGIEELKSLLITVKALNIANVEFKLNLARGLDYYTGTIIEVTADGSAGSLCAGGRYDDLTGIFGLKDVSGVGVSFGADRIYDLINEKNLFPESLSTGVKLMFVNFGDEEAAYCLSILAQLRAVGISAELYPDAAKMKKQMGYADAKGIEYVALVGSDELKSGKVTLKNMSSGKQEELTVEELLKKY